MHWHSPKFHVFDYACNGSGSVKCIIFGANYIIIKCSLFFSNILPNIQLTISVLEQKKQCHHHH